MPAMKRSYSSRRGQYKKKGSFKRPAKSSLRRTDTSTIDTTNTNNSGRVNSRSTDLSLFPSPFPPKKWVNFEYTSPLTAYAVANATGSISCKPSDLYDFDASGGNVFGNKQPLYYDTLLTGTGPYRQFKVWSWVITYTIVNNANAAITVYGLPTIASAGELDIASEFDNYPGVKKLFLTSITGSKNIGTITVRGALTDVYPFDKHSTALSGTYNASPTVPVYAGLGFVTAAGTVDVHVAVKATMWTEIGNVDALVS